MGYDDRQMFGQPKFVIIFYPELQAAGHVRPGPSWTRIFLFVQQDGSLSGSH